MAYAVENALYQWREGERRIAGAPEPAQADLDGAADVVVEQLRRRLGRSEWIQAIIHCAVDAHVTAACRAHELPQTGCAYLGIRSWIE